MLDVGGIVDVGMGEADGGVEAWGEGIVGGVVVELIWVVIVRADVGGGLGRVESLTVHAGGVVDVGHGKKKEGRGFCLQGESEMIWEREGVRRQKADDAVCGEWICTTTSWQRKFIIIIVIFYPAEL